MRSFFDDLDVIKKIKALEASLCVGHHLFPTLFGCGYAVMG